MNGHSEQTNGDSGEICDESLDIDSPGDDGAAADEDPVAALQEKAEESQNNYLRASASH